MANNNNIDPINNRFKYVDFNPDWPTTNNNLTQSEIKELYPSIVKKERIHKLNIEDLDNFDLQKYSSNLPSFNQELNKYITVIEVNNLFDKEELKNVISTVKNLDIFGIKDKNTGKTILCGKETILNRIPNDLIDADINNIADDNFISYEQYESDSESSDSSDYDNSYNESQIKRNIFILPEGPSASEVLKNKKVVVLGDDMMVNRHAMMANRYFTKKNIIKDINNKIYSKNIPLIASIMGIDDLEKVQKFYIDNNKNVDETIGAIQLDNQGWNDPITIIEK